MRGETPPTPEAGLTWLVQTVVNERATLGGLEEKLRVHCENRDRVAAVQRASLLAPEDMPFWLRYERMHDSKFYRAYNALERPEAPRSGPDGPEAGFRPEEPVGPFCDAGSGNESSGVSVPDAAPADEGLAIADEGNGERQTKVVVTDGPVVAVEEVAPAEAWVEEPIAVDARAWPDPGVAVEADVERQTKRVAPVEPVAPAVSRPTPSRQAPGSAQAGPIEQPAEDSCELNAAIGRSPPDRSDYA